MRSLRRTLSALLLATVLPAHATLHQVNSGSSENVLVLVGGIDNSWRYWASLLEDRHGWAVFGWVHDYRRATSLADSAAQLRDDLVPVLRRRPARLRIVAHSLGGLVARRALYELLQSSDYDGIAVDLIAAGTPWGGHWSGLLAASMPGGALVSRWLGVPMGPEMAPTSRFLLELTQPLPASVRFVIVESGADDIALGASVATRARYEAIAGQGLRLELPGVGHDAFNRFGALMHPGALRPSISSSPYLEKDNP